MSSPPSLPGFTLIGLLGRGAFADVWDAVHDDGRKVAVKVLRATDDAARFRFRREIAIARRIESPYVVRLVEASAPSREPQYAAYERLEGETLEERLESSDWLSVGETWPVARDVLLALEVAHAAAVVHRDVKPANIFLEAARARLLDFGVARAAGDPEEPPVRTTGGSTLGSLAYMAPEQAGGAADADARADLYGLGSVVFRCLSGRPPFVARSAGAMLALKLERDAPSLGEVTGDRWPAGVEAFLRGLLARDPARRFASARAALDAWEKARGAAMGGG